MKQNNTTIILWLLLITSLASFATEYTVSSHSEFNSLSLVAGDIVIWKNGTYSSEGDINFLGEGTADNPIILKAETPGKVLFTGRMQMHIGGSYLIVDGFYWKEGEGANNFIEFRKQPIYSDHCTLQNCVIDGIIINPDDLEEAMNPDDPDDTPSIPKHRWVVLYGNYNNVLNCTFMNKKSAGALILVELEYNAWTNGEPDADEGIFSDNTRSVEVGHTISNNYFFNFEKIDTNFSNAGDSETIRVGTSEYQNVNCATTVSNNYFVQADGENEIISNKSRNNKYINNTFRRSRGSLVLRHGAGATVEGNVFLGENIEGTGGLRVVDSDHIITNNYIQNCINKEEQAKWNNPITFMGGSSRSVTDPGVESLDNGYQKIENIILSNNTIVNSYTPIFFNGAKGQSDTKGVVSDNLIYYDVSNENLTDIINEDIIEKDGKSIPSFAPINELTFTGNVFNVTDLGQNVSGFEKSTTLTSNDNGEIVDIVGAVGKGANLNGYIPFTDPMVGNGIGACFLDANANIIDNPSCVIDGVEPTESINASSVSTFSSDEGDVVTTVSSTLSWTAESNNDWISISAESGENGDTEITISVEENTEFIARTGSITFIQDGEEGKTTGLSISQDAASATSNLTLINDGSDTDGVVVHSFSREQVGFLDGKDRFNYAINTLDKDTSTLWAGEDDADNDDIADGDGEYIIYDLNGIYDLDLIQLSTNDKDDAYGFQLWTSGTGTEASDFTQIIPTTGGIELTGVSFTDFNQYEVAATSVKYVKLIGFGRFNSEGDNNSVWTNITEIEFFGKEEGSLSVEEDLLNEVSIYPIPAKGTLYLKNLKTDISKLEIINLEGKTILTKEVSNSNGTLSMDTSSLGNGLYVLRISNADGYSVAKKIIIQQE